jgi:O-acetyl-ADP-ribose deacetylase (regulator of RNase III)
MYVKASESVEMRYILFDRNPVMVDSWKEFFMDRPDVEIVLGDLNYINCDTIVSPANSFGFMDGGIDYAISQRLGWGVQTKLQQAIKELPEGELLVGNAMVVATGDTTIPFLISAPTMRVPTNVNIASSVNAYLAMKATLVKAIGHSQISKIAIPGFCTGTGRMNKRIAAKQMFMAYKEVVLNEKPTFRTFAEAQHYQLELNPNQLIYK